MCSKGLFLILFVLFSGLLYAQESDTISSIDQALQELNNLEQNQTDLKNLIIERENTILEKERLLNLVTLQYQNLDQSYLLSENENKIIKVIDFVLIGVVAIETSYIFLRK